MSQFETVEETLGKSLTASSRSLQKGWGIEFSGLLRGILRLGVGEATAWIASFFLYAYVSRVYGVALLGIIAIAQTIATYVTMATDQGLRLIGARIVAKNPSLATCVVRPLIRKRLILCMASVTLGGIYAMRGPVPSEARLYVLGFVLAVIPYAFTLDWMAWGLNRMAWLGAWRGLIKVVFVAGAVLGMHFTGATLLPLVLANFAAISLGAILLAVLWYSVWRTRVIQPHESAVHELPKQLLWGPVLYLGMATMLNLVFNNADTLILAGMTSSVEVGRYNAAYKLIFIILSGYYLITQSLFPFLSAAPYDLHLRAWLYRALLVVAAAGTAIAVGIAVFSRQILSIIYGNDLGSMSLLRVLAFALPMDFCTSLMAVFLASRGRDKLLLSLTVAAAALNIGLNFVLIPRMQAQGSAWATVVSYGFLFAALLMSVPLVNA